MNVSQKLVYCETLPSCTTQRDFTYNFMSEVCQIFPESWKDLNTTSEFPVGDGTEVKLKCGKKRRVLIGDRTVTCTEGQLVAMNEEPECILTSKLEVKIGN